MNKPYMFFVTSFLKRLSKVRFSFVFVTLLLLLSLSPSYFVRGAEGSLVVVGVNQWVHVSVGSDRLESFSYSVYGVDLQLVFWSYNDSSMMLDAFLLTANKSVTDPLEKFSVYWDGIIGVSTVAFTVSSDVGQVATVVQDFTGEKPSWSRPKMTVRKEVITEQGKIYDVLVDNVHVASFTWDFVQLGSNETSLNQTVPQLTVYTNDGSIRDTKVLTTTFVSVTEYFDKVGFMVEVFGSTWIKWLLYSGFSLNVRLSRGFSNLALPYFLVSAHSIEPNNVVTVHFRLPDGVSSYSANWNTTYMSSFLSVIDSVFDSSSREYLVSLLFLDSAEGNRFTLEVSAEKFGTVYKSSDSVTVMAPAWKSLIIPGVVAIIIVFAFIFLIRRGSESRKTPPPASQALRG